MAEPIGAGGRGRLRFDPTIAAGRADGGHNADRRDLMGVRPESCVDHQDDLRTRRERRVDENAANGRIEGLPERIDSELDRKADKAP